ncbi:VOC family protein [Gillisia sp. Hel_I_29]|uniref:VOC family protein n=1 Tax=Gillisia sp. Hel_I_29 TaxID=1249975 RepID=UPI000A410F47|nr:VOC family protein [Gillisia sp. Hel_I_29]
MTFRYARHTNDLDRIEKFYTEIVGLEKLGGFKNHNNYNGLFLGGENLDWHLEFTTSKEKRKSNFDEDDILVFYVNSQIELDIIENIIKNKNIKIKIPKNPYWEQNGMMITDPDGYNIVLSIKHLELNSDDYLTQLVRSKNINNWSDLIELIKNLPYGRNHNRDDFSLVLKEEKGTCSSKHSFLKKIAELNEFQNIKLVLGIYRMNHLNTPKIEKTIINSGLEYIPEAHCYLRINQQRIDITNRDSDIDNFEKYIIEEVEIAPEQVSIFKVEYHKNYLKKWIEENHIKKTLEEIWDIREECIKKLEVQIPAPNNHHHK